MFSQDVFCQFKLSPQSFPRVATFLTFCCLSIMFSLFVIVYTCSAWCFEIALITRHTLLILFQMHWICMFLHILLSRKPFTAKWTFNICICCISCIGVIGFSAEWSLSTCFLYADLLRQTLSQNGHWNMTVWFVCVLRILFQNSSTIFTFRRPSVRGQWWHPTLSPLYDLLDHTNQIFSESLWHPLSTDPPTTRPFHFLTHQTHPKPTQPDLISFNFQCSSKSTNSLYM